MRQSALKIEQQETREATLAPVTAEFPAGRTPRMLIADDDPSILKLLADYCSRMGFEVETACNGVQAILKAGRSKPDVLLVDINMPEVDGMSVCARLLDPGKPPVDVIVITGSRDPDMLERCEGFGAFYARKGPNFWNDLEAALTEIRPGMASDIKRSRALAPAPAVRKRPHVLLVDDDDEVCRFLSSRLEKCGLDVQYASDAQKGFRMACSDDPAVIVTDYFMPNGDAQYLLTKLRTNSGTERIPVVVLSGRQLNTVTLRSLRLEICGHPGAAEILKKSQDTGPLFETLKKFCGFERVDHRFA